MKILNAGIIGCGNISSTYMQMQSKFKSINIMACADKDVSLAQEKASEFNISKPCTVDELLNDSEIELVINLTNPTSHAEIHLKALEAGKHTYSEKPLATTLDDGLKIINLAKSKSLMVGTAPDTFLGGGIQTCRKLIDDDWIGTPIAATAFMASQGPEAFHPNPEFLYQEGAGPMFDMGPYYLTALINLVGPVARVSGETKKTFSNRTIANGPRLGEQFSVNTPTHVAGTLRFENGTVGTIITSFDITGTKLPFIEIHGTKGSMMVPDPNTFSGPVYIKRFHHPDFVEIPLTHRFIDNSRGLGILDMVNAILNGTKHRANGELGFHVLEIMHGIYASSEQGEYYKVKSTCDKPDALPMNFSEMIL